MALTPMKIEEFYDPATFTLTYVVYDPSSRDAVVIDPVLDYDAVTCTTSTASLERLDAFLREKKLELHYVLETHAHADHLSGSQWLRRKYGAKIGIGARITEVQRVFKEVLALGEEFATDGRQFDRLFVDGETFRAGTLRISVRGTAGHTPACVSYLIGDAVFTGDALFIEDYGTGRCDFPEGSADVLYTSVHDRLYSLPESTRVFVGHDYQPNGRGVRAETTIGKSKSSNIQLRVETPRSDFVAMRRARDAKLAPPRLLEPSVRVNLDAGRLPKQYRNIDPASVARAPRTVHLVDVREPHELEGDLGRIAGAENVPLARVSTAATAWDKDEDIVVVCRSGGRSGRAAGSVATTCSGVSVPVAAT